MRRLPRRALSTACLALAVPARAQGRGEEGGYPAAPVTLVAPFAAGGAADLAARTLARFAPRHLPNPGAGMVVENRAGASGALGTQHVARAAPDGQTLLLARVSAAAILPALDPRTPYAWDGFTMLGLLDENPFVVCVRADAPWRSFATLLAALREQPGGLSFATTGPATLLDLGVRHIFATAGLPLDAGVAKPYRGGGEAVAALVAGEVDFLGNNLSDTIGAIRGGQLRALVVGLRRERHALLPQVPSAREVEFEALAEVTGWNALYAPPGLAAPAQAAWVAAIAALRGDAGWMAATRAVGSYPRLLPPEETRDYVRAQVALYHDLGRRLGLI
ncbi:tripartite tricarboxylate transporter substrate binding protein [Siccirubricoccus sp. KC 17139]|uniref:Tripartite tricarboxylate transporter substrate binding protein n=1 Tax=Siccirubricoccus soli TaxID=2899147 RepID=A0ABT1DC58_9PROT|nr:tripartite tricarboxylate transporter substrate binding protein [Siccirubricoccus soli]MCO6419527.1 tripartite tricarboxylate transporter substrate binding protein [Siccirubricoccus soli]MCP2685662.1 tripartite tricarboxylate transporter substrate binding protein [Siccirubricoccus soli]